MQKKERIVRCTAEELKEKLARGESETDWARVRAMTDEEVEADAASDPDEAGWEIDWSTTQPGIPLPKAMMTIRLDRDVFDWFRRQGPGYQTRINAVLRAHVEQMKRGG